jgi:AcrR family transcriptional regulator
MPVKTSRVLDVNRTARRTSRVRPGPISKAEADERAKLIVRVANEEFLGKGFEGATLASIAARCRISKTTLYGLFASKEALFMHVCSANSESFTYDIQHELDLSRPFEQVIGRVVSLMVNTCKTSPGGKMLRLVVAENKRFPQLGREIYARTLDLLKPLADYLKAMSGGALNGKDASYAAYHLTSMAVGGYGYLLVKPATLFGDSAAWTRSVTRLFLAGFPVAKPKIR